MSDTIYFDPNTLIQTDIITENNVQGKIYSQTVLLHGRKIKIIGKASQTIENYIDFGFYRPSNVLPSTFIFTNTMCVSEYFKDITNFFFVLAQIPLETNSILISLIKVCQFHIDNFQRLIDTDVYTYCDEALIVIELVLKSLDSTSIISTSEKVLMWEKFKSVVFENFKNNIYITKHEIDRNTGINLKPYLVKLDEFKM